MSGRVVTQTERADHLNMELAAKLGSLLPHATAEALEKIIAINELDLLTRARLLGYYWKDYESAGEELSSKNRDLRAAHILWFIENAPDCTFAGDYYLSCDWQTDAKNFDRISDAWKHKIKERPKCTQSRVNYAFFVFKHNSKLATELLKSVLAIDNQNEWALSLLPRLGVDTPISLPLEAAMGKPLTNLSTEFDRPYLTRSLRLTPASKHTILTQEIILSGYEFDLWARLDIVSWCQHNLRRANILGFDPNVLERLYRHLSWILRTIPNVRLGEFFLYDLDFFSGLIIPTEYFQGLNDLLLKVLAEPANQENVFVNWMQFYITNIGLQKTKELFFSLKAWKALTSKSRRALHRELNWTNPTTSIFQKKLNLDSVSIRAEHQLPQTVQVPVGLELLADELNLSRAYYDGLGYSHDEAADLEKALENFADDLVSTCRLYGYYQRHAERLCVSQIKRHQQLIQWIVENIPENYVAGHSLPKEKGYDSASLMETWQKAASKNPGNSRIAENIANSHFSSNKEVALRTVQAILEQEPKNVCCLALLQQLSYTKEQRITMLDFHDIDFESECDKRLTEFNTTTENEQLAHLFDEIGGYTYSLLDCLQIPQITLWTNQQALMMNPNDPILRLEILGWTDRHQLDGPIYTLVNPEIARLRTRQILWLVENTPHADLHFFIIGVRQHGIPSHEKVLQKAVKMQRKRYDKTVARYRPEFPRKKK